MHPSWLKLTNKVGRAVYVWASDIELVEDMGNGTLVRVHHDRIEVSESIEYVIAEADRINDEAERREAAESSAPEAIAPVAH